MIRERSFCLARSLNSQCLFPPRISSRVFSVLNTFRAQLQAVQASKEEVSVGTLSAQNLERAVRHLHEDGLVVVENVIEPGVLDRLNEKMVEDARVLQARGKESPFNYNRGNIQQDPPPIAAYFHSSVFLNPIATQITSAVLGPKPKLTFCSGNSALPPNADVPPQRQPVHADADFAHPSHPFALVVNVPLITMTPENGSTEIWLGTHKGFGIEAQEGAHGDRGSGRIREELLKIRRKTYPPLQPSIRKGSIVIRDLRLWHAGMPNKTDDIRVMLAMIHFAPWYRNQMKIELAEEIKSQVEKAENLDVRVDWVKESQAIDRYLNRGFGNSYDFNQTA